MKGAEWGEIEDEEEEKDGVEVKQQGKVKEAGGGGEYEKGRNDRSLRSGANLSAAKHTTDSPAARPAPAA